MRAAAVAVDVVLAAMLIATALRKLSHRDRVVASYRRVGVPEGRLNALATLLLLGAAGILTGILWPPIGIAAAGGLAIYFVVAMTFHVRANDARRLATPLTYFAMSTAVLVLLIASR